MYISLYVYDGHDELWRACHRASEKSCMHVQGQTEAPANRASVVNGNWHIVTISLSQRRGETTGNFLFTK